MWLESGASSLKHWAVAGVIRDETVFKTMNKYLLLLCLAMLPLDPALAQPVNWSALPADPPLTRTDLEKALAPATNTLPRFNLDFPGGTPGDLVLRCNRNSPICL